MSAEARIAALPLWRGRPGIEPIAAGRTNRNFLVEADGKRFFARVGQDIPQHGILRTAERRCAQLAADAGLAPRIVFAEAGIIITEYVDGKPLSTASIESSALRSRIADLLRQLHRIPTQPDLPRFCPVAAAHRYLIALADAALPVPRARIEARLAALSSPPPRCLVHGDLIPENFIRADDRLVLVDWEYSGNGVPETDIAMVLSNFGLAGTEAADFLGACGPLDQDLLEAMRVAAIIREALWCLMQARIGGMVGDLPQYTALCLDRLAGVLR
jgi:thiamine kinase-like enzyme